MVRRCAGDCLARAHAIVPSQKSVRQAFLVDLFDKTGMISNKKVNRSSLPSLQHARPHPTMSLTAAPSIAIKVPVHAVKPRAAPPVAARLQARTFPARHPTSSEVRLFAKALTESWHPADHDTPSLFQMYPTSCKSTTSMSFVLNIDDINTRIPGNGRPSTPTRSAVTSRVPVLTTTLPRFS